MCSLASVSLPQNNKLKLPRKGDCAPSLVAFPTTYIEPTYSPVYMSSQGGGGGGGGGGD